MALEQKYNDEQHTSTDVSVSPTNEREKEMQTTTSDGETETQEFFWDALMLAVVQNEPKRVRSLLKRSDPNRKSPNGNTPLHIAATEAFTTVMRLLLTRGADPNAKNTQGETPLHWAAFSGDVGSCRMLVKAGAKVDSCDDQQTTPLFWAIENEQYEAIVYLLSVGASVEVSQHPELGSVLQLASSQSEPIALRLLIHFHPDLFRELEGLRNLVLQTAVECNPKEPTTESVPVPILHNDHDSLSSSPV